MIDPEAPAWLKSLVADTWDERDWQAWRDIWKPELAKRGVTPDMLKTVGDPARPIGISVDHPDLRWCHGPINWSGDESQAVLSAFNLLVQDLDAAVGKGPSGRVRR